MLSITKHWAFTDTGVIVENVKDNLPGLDNYDFVANIIGAYKSANAKLGFDYDPKSSANVRAYADTISSVTQYPNTYITTVLSIWSALLTKDYIDGPLMRLQAFKNVPAVKDGPIDGVFDWITDIGANIGEGVKNTSVALKYLPVILIGAGGLYILLTSKKR